MIRAMTHHDRLTMTVAIVIYDEEESPETNRRILRIVGIQDDGELIYAWESHEPHTAIKPTLNLGYREALALQEALAELAIGTADYKMIRKDYDAERDRVDKLIDTLATTLRTTAARP